MDNLDYIDSFFGGKASPEETSQFEKKIQEDPVFAEEVAYYLGARGALKEANAEERRARFRELYQGESRVGKLRSMGSGRWLPYAAAAVVLGMVALAWLLYLRPADPAKIADRYIHKNLSALTGKMGGADVVQNGVNLYNEGKLSEALQLFEGLLEKDSLHPAALLNAGLASLRMENYDKALDFFSRLEIHTDPHMNPALFYEALTLMKRNHAGDSDHAKLLLQRIVQEDLNRKGDAKELLDEL